MMLHRHFEGEAEKNLSTSEDLNRKANEEKEEFVSEIFPPEPSAQPKRKRKQTTTEE